MKVNIDGKMKQNIDEVMTTISQDKFLSSEAISRYIRNLNTIIHRIHPEYLDDVEEGILAYIQSITGLLEKLSKLDSEDTRIAIKKMADSYFSSKVTDLKNDIRHLLTEHPSELEGLPDKLDWIHSDISLSKLSDRPKRAFISRVKWGLFAGVLLVGMMSFLTFGLGAPIAVAIGLTASSGVILPILLPIINVWRSERARSYFVEQMLNRSSKETIQSSERNPHNTRKPPSVVHTSSPIGSRMEGNKSHKPAATIDSREEMGHSPKNGM